MDDQSPPKSLDTDSRTAIDPSEMAEVLDADQALAARQFGARPAVRAGDEWLSLLADLREFYSHGTREPADTDEATPTRLGKFEVHECVGIGGFGCVYRATDTLLGREVALKVPAARVLGSPQHRVRFLREARASAVLAHPNIVPVFESGQEGPFHFIAAQFCRGPTLARWLRERSGPVPPDAAARLLIALAGAVQHAHEHRILHRDLKPANILLETTTATGPELDDLDRLQPRITDFGLAKVLDEIEEQTHTGDQIGTPPYMAPEQAAGRTRDIGPATDVYALGSILYEVLTLRPPFVGETPHETRMLVCQEDPAHPRTSRPRLPRDLETICLKCLAKDPKRRYPSAVALGDDLHRFLDGRAIAARPVPSWERATKWVRRKPFKAAFVALSATVVAGVVGASVGYVRVLESWNRRIAAALAESDRQRVRAERHYSASEVHRASVAVKENRADQAQDILYALERSLAAGGPSTFARRYLSSRLEHEVTQLRGHRDRVNTLALSPDGRLLVTGARDGEIIVWNLATGSPRSRLTGHRHAAVATIEFSNDGRLLASGAIDYRTSRWEFVLWDVGTSRALTRWTIPEGRVEDAVVDTPSNPLEDRTDEITSRTNVPLGRSEPDAQGQARFEDLVPAFDARNRLRLMVGVRSQTRHRIQVWDMHSIPAEPRVILDEAADDFPIPGHLGAYLAFDGNEVCVKNRDSSVSRLFRDTLDLLRHDIEVRKQCRPARGSDGAETRFALCALSPDKQWIARAQESGALTMIHRPTRSVRELLQPQPGWKANSTNPASTIYLEFAPDSSALAASVDDQVGEQDSVLIWSTETDRRPLVFRRSTTPYGARIRFLPDSRTLAVGGANNVRLWHWRADAVGVRPLPQPMHDSEAWGVTFSPDGSTLASSGDDNKIRLWNPANHEAKAQWDAHEDTVAALAYRPDGDVLATVSLGVSDNVRLWDPQHHRLIATLRGHSDKVRAVAYSSNGRTLATAGSDRTVRLWDGSRGNSRAVLTGHQEMVKSIGFAPDGSILASASLDASVRIWDVASAALVAEFRLPEGAGPAHTKSWLRQGLVAGSSRPNHNTAVSSPSSVAPGVASTARA